MDTPRLQPPAETPPIVTTLERMGESLQPARIERLWIFPPRRAAGQETAVVVATLLPETADEPRRRVFTAHYVAIRDRRGRLDVQHALAEHAAARPDRLDAAIDGVLRRLDDTLPSLPPRIERIDGDPLRWHAVLDALRALPPAVARGVDVRY